MNNFESHQFVYNSVQFQPHPHDTTYIELPRIETIGRGTAIYAHVNGNRERTITGGIILSAHRTVNTYFSPYI